MIDKLYMIVFHVIKILALSIYYVYRHPLLESNSGLVSD